MLHFTNATFAIEFIVAVNAEKQRLGIQDPTAVVESRRRMSERIKQRKQAGPSGEQEEDDSFLVTKEWPHKVLRPFQKK
jgi:hypothetical protein